MNYFKTLILTNPLEEIDECVVKKQVLMPYLIILEIIRSKDIKTLQKELLNIRFGRGLLSRQAKAYMVEGIHYNKLIVNK